MFELPPEVIAKPLALIGLAGLDLSNPIHRSISDAFTNNRRDNVTIQFKLLNPNHEFPTVKPKRNSYEWYIPKGILKRNWMNKYLYEIPSVIVFFYELDWNDPAWNEKKMECASRIQSWRTALEGRSTKVSVVLIQRGTQPLPGTEDTLATERATALCAACELPVKLLYVLPYRDHLPGYTSRLETAFSESAQSYYHHECRGIKNHRDHLSKVAHQYLLVRHQFKMGFLNELKQDLPTAQKHYMQAYSNLLDIRTLDVNVLEIKMVASFINYKLCRIMFTLNYPKEAISQFKLYIERFKLRTGPKELLFEHYAWMATQYSTFAELFDEAIRQGLPAVQTQHPGYYFESAARYASLRHSACKELCRDVTSYPEPDPLAGEDKLEFYGQRPWRPGKSSIEPADTTRETIALQALQYREKTTVNHSMIITGLLGNAISQFKIYRCPRMRRVLVVRMAEEYYNAKDYGKVLTLLMHMLWEHRSERWPVLLTDIIRNALRAAYLSANVQDYLVLAFEALAPSTTFTNEQRAEMYNNVANILQRKAPNPEPNLPDDDKLLAIEKWNNHTNWTEPFVFIDDNNTVFFVEVKARFSQAVYIVNSTINVEVFVRNLYCGEIAFSKISITVGNNNGSTELPVINERNDNFHFRANETRKFLCQFPALRQNSEIRISTVSLYLGNAEQCSVILHFAAAGREAHLLDRLYPEIQCLRGGEFEMMKPLTSAEIKEEESYVSITAESEAPALLGEWFPITVLISTTETISDVVITVTFMSDQSSNEQSTELSLNMNTKQTVLSIDIESIKGDESIRRIVYVRGHKTGERKFHIKIEYGRSEETRASKELIYHLSMSKPFEVTTQFYTSRFEQLTKAFIDEPFIIMPHISCTSPWPIQILNTTIELGDSLERENSESDNQNCILPGTILKDGESGTDAYCVVPKSGSEQPTSTGVYTVRWKRANSEHAIETSSSVTLTPLWVEDAAVGLEAKLPAYGWVRTPLCVTYIIKNHSDYLITLRLTMEASDAFMFAGQKQVDVCILPKNGRKVEWILRPLVAGFVALPMLSLTVPSDEEHKMSKSRLAEILERSLPSHIYIMPKSQNLEN